MLRKGAFFDTYYIMCNRPVCGTFRRLREGGDSSRSRGVRIQIYLSHLIKRFLTALNTLLLPTIAFSTFINLPLFQKG